MALRKSADPRPQISQVTPPAAIAGGELQIRGKGFAKADRPRVVIGEVTAPVIIGSDSFVIARVPDGATAGELVIASGKQTSESWACDIGVPIADSLHPVANPAIDSFGNIYSTFSGSRGQKVPVAVYKVDLNFTVKPFINELMNATGLAFDAEGMLYISSRHDGVIYQITPNGNMSVFVEGMGVATGIAFDREHNLYVGDRSGTIFKISPNRRSSSSPRWSLPSPPTISPSAPTITFTSPAPPLPASMPSTACPIMARSRCFTAASDVRRAWPSMKKAISMSQHRSPGAKALSA